ncbi:MAG: Na/Pi cotransporter family protein [Acetobacteraceae bacterium]|nr:Na/Pi cotransporter family protein [Acetobacteraceae bacterium]
MTVYMAFGLLGGLGMFLYGMRLMGDGLQKAAGDRMRRLLEVLTTNPLMGVLVGTVVTATIQSSSATTVMVVGFVNAGLMSLRQAAGVIMGANIGTTVTAQLIAFRLATACLPAIALGVGLIMFSRRRVNRYIGQIILGFGLLFLGMETMSQAMRPLKDSPGFTLAMTQFGRRPLLGVLVGVAMTGIVQSSSATIGVLQALAAQGLVDIRAALPILCGDNIGTCVTALLASIGTSVTARRAAVIHLAFNVVGTVLYLVALPAVLTMVLKTSVDPVRQIANAHTIFNVSNTVIQLPLIRFLVLIASTVVPGRVEVLERGPKYLEKRLLNSPAIALAQARRELYRMGQLARETLSDAIGGFFKNDEKLFRSAHQKEEVVNELEQQVTHYLAQLGRGSLTDPQAAELSLLLNAVKDIERVGDHAENITELAEYKVEHGLPFSPQALSDLEFMCSRVDEVLGQALEALRTNDLELAAEIMRAEDAIDQIEKDLRRAHIRRLNEGKCYPGSGIVFLDIISNLERIGDHASGIAQGVLGETEG